eukprot:1733743-Rhodomonas_salina.3
MWYWHSVWCYLTLRHARYWHSVCTAYALDAPPMISPKFPPPLAAAACSHSLCQYRPSCRLSSGERDVSTGHRAAYAMSVPDIV